MRSWKQVLAGAAVALPSLLWAGDKVWGALREAEKIPILEVRMAGLDQADRRLEAEVRQLRALILEMLMLQHREFGDNRRAQEIADELRKLKEVK